MKERKQVWVTDCVSKTVVTLNLEGNKAKLVEHEFKEPTGIAFLLALDVATDYRDQRQPVRVSSGPWQRRPWKTQQCHSKGRGAWRIS